MSNEATTTSAVAFPHDPYPDRIAAVREYVAPFDPAVRARGDIWVAYTTPDGSSGGEFASRIYVMAVPETSQAVAS